MSIKSCKIGLLWVYVVLSMVCVTVLKAEPACKAVQQTKPAANSAEQTAAYEAVIASYNTQEAAKETPPQDPYADAQILVEAFVVEVTTAGLKDLGVSPLGQTPDGISIAKLTDCLMKDKGAKVVSGAKVTAKQGNKGEAKEQKTIYMKEKWRDDFRFMNYSLEKSFAAITSIVSDYNVSVVYSYLESGPQIDPNYDPNKPAPLNKYSYNWNGQFNLQSNKPQIAAAVQNRDNVVFLVLTATIQKDIPTQTPAAEEKKEKSK